MNSEVRNCQSCRGEFVVAPEDFGFYEKIKVPPPTWCPLCRFQRRIVFRNERKVFWATSGMTGKKIISLYPPASGFVVYEDDIWRSDAWDPLDYGREIDFTRPFLTQIQELNKLVPKGAAACINMVDSPYSGNADGLKNCYLMFNSNHCENSAYGNGVDYSFNCYDNSHIQKCERCYNSFWLTNCNQAYFSVRCEDSSNIWYSRDCRGCSDCFGCTNLRLKKNCIFNVQYTKEEYDRRLAEMELSSDKALREAERKAHDFWGKQPYKFMQGTQNANVSGEYIANSKDAQNCYLIRNGEHLKYSQYLQVPPGNDCYDSSMFGDQSELLYETSVCGWHGRAINFCFETWSNVSEVEYCLNCQHSTHLFGCVGMRSNEYCILNKKYTPEDYEVLVEKVKKHMADMPYVDKLGRTYKYGEFFPPEFAPVAYNQSIAPEHFLITKEEALAEGFSWADPEPQEYQTTILAKDISENIPDLGDAISNEAIQCSNCQKGYRIILGELQFLKQAGIAAPRLCVDCRHTKRISWRNKNRLYARHCMCMNSEHGHTGGCAVGFETSFAPDGPEIVYCESCYNNEVA